MNAQSVYKYFSKFTVTIEVTIKCFNALMKIKDSRVGNFENKEWIYIYMVSNKIEVLWNVQNNSSCQLLIIEIPGNMIWQLHCDAVLTRSRCSLKKDPFIRTIY